MNGAGEVGKARQGKFQPLWSSKTTILVLNPSIQPETGSETNLNDVLLLLRSTNVLARPEEGRVAEGLDDIRSDHGFRASGRAVAARARKGGMVATLRRCRRDGSARSKGKSGEGACKRERVGG